MLVISRKSGDSLIIADNIKITVISLSNDKVTIGIDAPKDIKIIREELIETIEANIASNEKVGQADFKGIAELIKNNKNSGNK